MYGNDDNHGRSEGVAWVARVAMESCTCGNPDICEGVACVETLNAYVKVLHMWRHSRHTRRCCMCGDIQCICEGTHGEGREAVRPYKNLQLFHKC